MQHVTTALSTSKPTSLAEPIPQRWVARIFDRLTAQLGAKVADLYAGVPAENVQAEWAEALAGFAPAEIERGVRACQTRIFAPTLGEFLRLCRPGLDPELAWFEACEGMRAREAGELGEWTHPAVYRAAGQFAFELKTSSLQPVRRRWEWILQREFAKGWGEDVKPPLQQIEHKPALRQPTEHERKALAELRAMFVRKPDPDETPLSEAEALQAARDGVTG
jgi:hypothetical protein